MAVTALLSLAAAPAPIATAETVVLRPPPGLASDGEPWAAFVSEASHRFAIPEPWIHAVIAVESAGVADATSPKGAMGLMQLMPETYAGLRDRYGLGSDAYDPRDNILAGTALLRELHDRFGAPGFLAAYNAGPERYLDHLETGQPLPSETQAYLAALTPVVTGTQPAGVTVVLEAAPNWQAAPLFVGRQDHALGDKAAVVVGAGDLVPDGSPDATPKAFAPHSDGLFAGTADAQGLSWDLVRGFAE